MYLCSTDHGFAFLLFYVMEVVDLQMVVYHIHSPTQKLAKQRKNQYEILSQRIEREKKMYVISQKIQTRKDLQVSLNLWYYR